MEEQIGVILEEEKELNESKAIGGHARAKALSPEQRKEIARKAAEARWGVDIPQATHEGEVRIGSAVISAAVLPGGKRVLSQSSFLLLPSLILRPLCSVFVSFTPTTLSSSSSLHPLSLLPASI